MNLYEIHEAISHDVQTNSPSMMPDCILIPEGKEIPSGKYERDECAHWVRVGSYEDGF